MSFYRGFVVAELLITIVILAIVSVLAAPSYRNFVEQNRLSAAAEGLYIDMNLARSEAIRKQTNVYVSFHTGTNWCYGLSEGAACNCQVSSSCMLNGVEKIVTATSFPNVSMATANFASNEINFDGVHGATGDGGQVDFSLAGKTLSVAIKSLGHAKVCASNVGGYSPC